MGRAALGTCRSVVGEALMQYAPTADNTQETVMCMIRMHAIVAARVARHGYWALVETLKS